MQHYDIAVIGAGVAGLSCALGFAQLGQRVIIVDANPPSAHFDSASTSYDQRVYAMSLASERLLTNLGAWQYVAKERLCRYQDMRVWSDKTPLHFGCELIGRNHLGTIVEQQILLSALCRALAQYDQRQLSWQQASLQELNFTKDVPQILTSAGKISADLIIGADGANSKTRELAGFEYSAKPYRQTAIVATVKTELDHQNTAWQRFLQSGPLAFLPLGEPHAYHGAAGHFCSIVWSADTDRAAHLQSLGDADFALQLGNSFADQLGAVELIGKRASFELVARHSAQYVRPNLALIADAAHTVHPLAGQGLNLGLLDVGELLKRTRAAKSISAYSALLAYQRVRRHENQLGLWSMASIKSIFNYKTDLGGLMLQRGIDTLNSSRFLRAQLAAQASGVHFDVFQAAHCDAK